MKTLLATLLMLAPAQAGEMLLQVDTAKTTVSFKVESTLHTVHGTFQLKSGSLRLDPQTGKASGQLFVDARSGQSGSDGRDNRMHKAVLESDRFPEITFTADRIEGALNLEGDSAVQLHGTLTIHGGQHEIALPTQVHIEGNQVRATAAFPVPYIKWGMKNPGNFLLKVNDTVTIEIVLRGGIAPAT